MKKSLYFIGLSILLCAIFDASAFLRGGNLKRITSDFNIYDVSSSAEQKSIYQQIEKFCANNHAKPYFSDQQIELQVLFELYHLAKKIGYQKREGGGKEYYVVDISWPSIKVYAEKVAVDGSPLRELLNQIGEVRRDEQNDARTKIEDEQKTFLLAECDKLFDLSELKQEESDQIKKIIEGMLGNYSGFQRIASVLVVGLLNSEKDGFVKDFTKIKIKKIEDEKPSNCSLEAISLQNKYYRSRNQRDAEETFMHELTHAFHYMVVPSKDNDAFYKNSFPFFVQSALSNDNFRDVFIPMLARHNLEIENNPSLKKIQEVLEKNKEKVDKLINEVAKISQGNESTSEIAKTLFYILTTIVKNGFGEIVFGDSWENELKYTLNAKSLARAIYVRTLVFSEIDRSTGLSIPKASETHHLSSSNNKLVANWLGTEEILTMLGTIVFSFRGGIFFLEDRNNEQIFRWRAKEKDASTEQEAKIYREHELNFSITEADKFVRNFVGEIIGVEISESERFFGNINWFFSLFISPEKKFNDLLFPKELVHKKAGSGNTERANVVIPSVRTQDDLFGSMFCGFLNSAHDETSLTNITLHIAAANGDVEVAELLIQHGATVDAKDGQGLTPLHWAAQHNNKDVANFLIDSGANIKACDRLRRTPLHWAAQCNSKDVAELLINKAREIAGENVTDEFVNLTEDFGKTPLYLAAQLNDKGVANLLIDSGANIDAPGENGQTPLRYAIRRNNKDVANFLIDSGVSIDAPGKNGQTPLHYAVLLNKKDIVELLIDKGANIEAPGENGRTPLHYAVWLNNEDIVELLIDKGANIEAPGENGQTPLHYAIQRNNKDIVELLIDEGANIEAPGENGRTPLHYAIQLNNKDLAKLLIDEGANIEVCDEDWDTPLHYAIQRNNKDIAKLLIDRGANIDAPNKNKITPAEMVDKKGHPEIAKLFEDKRQLRAQAPVVEHSKVES